MNVTVTQEAKKDLNQLEEDVRDRILEKIEDLEENATPDNATYIEIGDMDLFRLKIQEEDRNSKLNHRIFYQIKDKEVYIRGIFHRNQGYGTKTRKELEKRI